MARVGEEQLLGTGTTSSSRGKDAEAESSSPNEQSQSYNEESEPIERKIKLPARDLFKQILLACTIHSVVIQAGINLSFSAVLLPQLAAEYNASTESLNNATSPTETPTTNNNSTIYIDKDAASWIASLVTLSLPLGALIVGSLMDKFGRKRIAMLTTIPFTTGWLLHYWAQNVNMIYAARIIAGFGSGLSTVCLIYVAELSHPKLRAMLLNLNSLFVCFGILITCAIGSVLHWRTMSLCYATLSLSSCLSIMLLPESPHWLHSFKNKTSHATKILSWLYSDDAVFQIEERRLWDNQIQRQRQTYRDIAATFTTPIVYKPLQLLFILFLLQQLTGCYVIVFYAVDVFKLIGNGMDEYSALILLGAIRFVAAILSSITSIRLGRKILLITSAAGMLVSALLAASSVGHTTSWCVLSYVAFGSIGVLVIPWTLIGELLPLKVRGKLGGFLFALAYLFMFGMVKGYPYLSAIVEIRTMFYWLVGVNAVMIYFVAARLPETFGKSFRQIEEYFLA
ncbi:facilitated trehalose transporter Tret1-2 homolog [Atheta coriaria]|uniref:facilitated trehalose transporter Tret1-2 homolog n=1 Tax=Dalotia coriaria TaxID=877792 RepID=UPI0031F37A3A